MRILPAPNARDAIEVALREMLSRAEESGAGKKTMARLTEIVFRYQDVFRLELGHDPPADVEPMVIELVEGLDTGKVQRARIFAPLQMEFLHEHVRMLLDMGVVRRSNSAHSSPVVLVRKKDGRWRMSIDLRQVNAATKPMRWPLPKIHELLPHPAESAFYASFDLLRGFWQFPIADGCAQNQAFVTHEG